MPQHTHLCEYCGQEWLCRCEEVADVPYLPCEPCLQDTVIPPWERQSRPPDGATPKVHTRQARTGPRRIAQPSE